MKISARLLFGGIGALFVAYAAMGLFMQPPKKAQGPAKITRLAGQTFNCRVREGKVGYTCGWNLVSPKNIVLEDTTFEELSEYEIVYCRSEDGQAVLCRRNRLKAREQSRADFFI